MANPELIQARFFKLLFRDEKGFVAVMSKRGKKGVEENFFEYPEELDELTHWCQERSYAECNVYFCPQLFSAKSRRKEYVSVCTCIWADLDEADLSRIEPAPTLVVESSPGRTHGYWRLHDSMPAVLAEEYSKRIAYAYKEEGVDQSGWDLTQLLRVPYTKNYKYDGTPLVAIIRNTTDVTDPDEFERLSPTSVGAITREQVVEVPTELPDVETIIEKYTYRLPTDWHSLFTTEPRSDWSGALWRFMRMSFEAGMDRNMVFAVSAPAACNKFRRDAYRSNELLWNDVLRAERKFQSIGTASGTFEVPVFVDPNEFAKSNGKPGFIELYVDWATRQSDAPAEYHEASAFIILSALLSGHVHLPTKIGNIKPNLWVMILADSTLTRKTTSMKLATQLLFDAHPDEDFVFATDGTIEGIFKAMSMRPGKSSMFVRDEVTGLIESSAKKDYMAGTLEGFTKLYDGDTLKRTLSKDRIIVTDPVFLFYAGGIKSRMETLLSREHILSGFIPRFIIVSGRTDIGKLQPLGPAEDIDYGKRLHLRKHLEALYGTFCQEIAGTTPGGSTVLQPQVTAATLTPEAWKYQQEIETRLNTDAYYSADSEVILPVIARAIISQLKMAVLISASDVVSGAGGIDGGDKLLVTEQHIARAAYYMQRWIGNSVHLATTAGSTVQEKLVQRALYWIERNPGKTKAHMMRQMKLSKPDTQTVITTLQDRGEIDTRSGPAGSVQLWKIENALR